MAAADVIIDFFIFDLDFGIVNYLNKIEKKTLNVLI
jgi:hypothetical protein